MTLLGFTAFLDPARTDAKASIDHLESMGVEMKVITGDNELVTEKICRDIGIRIKGMLLGHDIDNISDEALRQKSKRSPYLPVSVRSRNHASSMPLRPTGTLSDIWETGSMTLPAFRLPTSASSVSNAVDIARETADIILTHKSLAELRDGVVEGTENFRKYHEIHPHGTKLQFRKYVQCPGGGNFPACFCRCFLLQILLE